MRQIKFRGKNSIDDWWYGNLITREYLKDGQTKHIYEISDITTSNFCTGIIPETVGQFTGLTDKNGKEIYEGDILEYDTGKRYVVVYSIEAFDSGTNEHYIGAYMLRDDHNFHELICNVTRPYKYAEIIGNIHDNPELLTK